MLLTLVGSALAALLGGLVYRATDTTLGMLLVFIAIIPMGLGTVLIADSLKLGFREINFVGVAVVLSMLPAAPLTARLLASLGDVVEVRDNGDILARLDARYFHAPSPPFELRAPSFDHRCGRPAKSVHVYEGYDALAALVDREQVTPEGPHAFILIESIHTERFITCNDAGRGFDKAAEAFEAKRPELGPWFRRIDDDPAHEAFLESQGVTRPAILLESVESPGDDRMWRAFWPGMIILLSTLVVGAAHKRP